MGSDAVPGQRGPRQVINCPSPNFGHRRDGIRPDMVVLHSTAMESAEAALERLCAPEFEVSAHYLIAKGGETYRLVDENFRAWHAGAGSWGAASDINSRSIGIELDNAGGLPFPEPQMAALESLFADIFARWSISPERVIAHSDMAPTRKVDPGPNFDWRRLSLVRLSIWPEEEPHAGSGRSASPVSDISREAAFRKAALEFGYPDVDTETLLAAFRLRFRPLMEGTLSESDLTAMQSLARRFPVDRVPSNP